MKTLYTIFFLLLIMSPGLAQEARDSAAVYFPFDKHALTPEAKKQLDAFIAEYKSGTAGRELIIKGYCDVIGSHPYNDQLSENRTLSVQKYLLAHGIPSSAVTLRKGYGKRLPVNDNSTAEERQENRRVEIIWTAGSTAMTHISNNQSVKETPADFTKAKIDSVKEGETLRLRNINFYGGRHFFLPTAMEPLAELLDAMKKNPTLVIEIQGHICCHNDATTDGLDLDTGEMSLSLNRAKAVYAYLVENGIDKNRMSYKGFGRKYPLVDPEITEEEKTTNRRVEIKIVKK